MASPSPRATPALAEADLRALADRIKGLGLANLAASLLESHGALGVLGAQLLYLSQPLLGGFAPDTDLNQVGAQLEATETMQTLISLLREETV